MINRGLPVPALVDPSARLRKALQEGRANTEMMIKKLQSFEGQLDGIESDLRPLQDGTQRYTIAKENISKTLAECGKTYEYFRICVDVKHIANSPYKREKQREIFDAMDRLSKAKAFFEKHREMRSSGTMLDGVNTMLSTLEDKCVNECSRLWKNVGSTVETIKGGTNQPDQYQPIQPFEHDQVTVSEIQNLAHTLDGLKLTRHLEAYKESRIKQVHVILEEQKNSRTSCWNKLYSDDFPFHIRSNNPLSQYMAMVLELLKGEVQLWGILFVQTPFSMQIFLDICHKALDEIHDLISPFLDKTIYSQRAHLKKESQLVHPNNVFLIRMDLLDCFMVHYHSIYDVCKPDFRKESSSSKALINLRNSLIYACIEGTHELLRSSKDIGPILDPCTGDSNIVVTAQHFIEKKIIKPIEYLGNEIEDIVGFGNNINDSNDDGIEKSVSFTTSNAGEKCDLLPMTNDVLHCCSQLLQYGKLFVNKLNSLSREVGQDMPLEAKTHSSFLFGLLQNLKANFEERGDCISAAVSAMSMANGTSNSGSNSIAGGALSVMDHLNPMSILHNSEKKLDRDVNTHNLYESGDKEAELAIMGGCQYLFKANNFSSLYSFLLKNKNELYNCISAKLLDSYYIQVKDSIELSRAAFCNTITRVLGMSRDDIAILDQKYKETTDKTTSGRLIKAKFATFNNGLEALLAQQGAWRISSAELRDEMGKQLALTVVPVYKEFYSKYSKVNFSKRHMDQYVRFTEPDVQLILGRFFGGAVNTSG